MANWTVVTTDNFTRANTTVDATPGNTDSVGLPSGGGTAWIDVVGNDANINTNQLIVTPASSTAPATVIARPTSEDAINSRIVIQYVAQNPLGSRIGTVLRTNGLAATGNNSYLYCGTSSSGLALAAEGFIAGAGTAPATTSGANGTTISLPTAGHTMQLDAWAFTNTTGPTFVQAQLTDITANPGVPVSTTLPAWDSNVTLQSTGQQAIVAWRQTAGGTPVAITSAITYTGNPDAVGLYLMGPTSGAVSSPSTFTVVPGGGFLSGNTVSLTSSVGGDTISSSQTPTTGSTTPLTFTVTPSTTGARTITIANTGTLTNFNTITLTAGTATFSASPTLAFANTQGQVITLTGVGTGWTPGNTSTFTISGGFNTLLQSQVITSATAATITIDPGNYGWTPQATPGLPIGTLQTSSYGVITITDTVNTLTQTITVSPKSQGTTINLGFVGDSITISNVNDTAGYLSAWTAQFVQSQGYTVSHLNNSGLDGSATDQWTPTSTYSYVGPNGGTNMFTAALLNFTAAGLSSGDTIHVMLGTNDARPATSSETRAALTPTQHFANMTAIVNGLVSHGYKVVLAKPLWTWPYANNTAAGGPANNGERWLYNCNDLYNQYWALDITLANGTTIFLGDTAGYEYSQANSKVFLQPTGTSPGIHPAGATADQQLAQMWGTGIIGKYGSSGSAPAATKVYITGQSTSVVSVAQTLSFFLDAAAPTGGVTITPTITSGGGTLSAMSGAIAAGSVGPVTCTYTPSSAGAKVISFTNSASLTNTGSPFTTTASSSGGGSGGGVIIG